MRKIFFIVIVFFAFFIAFPSSTKAEYFCIPDVGPVASIEPFIGRLTDQYSVNPNQGCYAFDGDGVNESIIFTAVKGGSYNKQISRNTTLISTTADGISYLGWSPAVFSGFSEPGVYTVYASSRLNNPYEWEIGTFLVTIIAQSPECGSIVSSPDQCPAECPSAIEDVDSDGTSEMWCKCGTSVEPYNTCCTLPNDFNLPACESQRGTTAACSPSTNKCEWRRWSSPLCTPSVGGDGINTAFGCFPINNLPTIVGGIMAITINFGGAVALIVIAYAAFSMMTSTGNPERLEFARSVLTSVFSGLLFALGAAFIFRVISVGILGLF